MTKWEKRGSVSNSLGYSAGNNKGPRMRILRQAISMARGGRRRRNGGGVWRCLVRQAVAMSRRSSYVRHSVQRVESEASEQASEPFTTSEIARHMARARPRDEGTGKGGGDRYTYTRAVNSERLAHCGRRWAELIPAIYGIGPHPGGRAINLGRISLVGSLRR